MRIGYGDLPSKLFDEISRNIVKIRHMPNDKAEFNDVKFAPISLSLTEINNPWPDGDHNTRSDIFEQYKDWSLGLIYFLQNDPEVPVEVRHEMGLWALPADEFVDTDNWTPALYVREARRMVGSYVFTEHDTGLEPNSVRSLLQKRSVAISDYSLSTHGVMRPASGEHVGVIGRRVMAMQIPFDIIVPKEIDGLLVPVAVSASHVGFAALRYEPLWTALGQAAGIAAAKSIRDDISVRNIDIHDLQLRLHELGALTIYVSDLGEPTDVTRPAWEQPSEDFRIWLNKVPPVSPLFRPVQYFGTLGFFHSLVDPESADDWSQGRSTGQWALRVPYHAFEPDKLVDEALARDWLARAADLGIQSPMSATEVVNQNMSRGDMLQMLFELL